MNYEEKEKMIEVAGSWVGYTEKKEIDYMFYDKKFDNAGSANFTRFGRIADMVMSGSDIRNKDGFPWCAMFVISCIYESFAGRQDCTSNHLSVDYEPRKRTIDEICGSVGIMRYMAGVDNILKCFYKRGRISKNPERGDLVVYVKNGRGYHIGIVEHVLIGEFVSIEGNTSAIGERIDENGGCVAKKCRKITKDTVFLRM